MAVKKTPKRIFLLQWKISKACHSVDIDFRDRSQLACNSNFFHLF